MSKFTPIQFPLPVEGATIEIPLTQGQIGIIDAIDGDLALFKWFAYKQDKNIYVHRTVRKPKRTVYALHRVILERIVGRVLASNEFCDHINGNSLDNRRDNLRLANPSQSAKNRGLKSDNTSGYKGVSWNTEKRKWYSQIKVDGHIISLGYFNNIEDAYEAYCKAAVQYHGEFARLK